MEGSLGAQTDRRLPSEQGRVSSSWTSEPVCARYWCAALLRGAPPGHQMDATLPTSSAESCTSSMLSPVSTHRRAQAGSAKRNGHPTHGSLPISPPTSSCLSSVSPRSQERG